ncbi:MAG: hypothetical protein HY525_07295 [Betaproteobacteria bacterium]|nr:hypothetical protein [Betaproteobacteria bacterium]
MADSILRTGYEDAKQQCGTDSKSIQAGDAILHLATISLKFLVTKCKPIDLVSRVPGKQYFSFKKANVIARPANKALFMADSTAITRLWKQWLAEAISPTDFAKLTYTIALAPCLAMEIFDRQNKKGPATFFECYIGHLFAKAVGINPTKRARLPVHGRDVLMTMDFLIDMGKKHRKVHLPVKMSTRERVVQAWAHQRLLDAAYGNGVYRGIMVLFSETKLDSRSLEVVEICVPDQWLAYQALLAHMDRIYYFDVPVRYQELTEQFPDVIAIKQFGEFFNEKEAVLHS